MLILIWNALVWLASSQGVNALFALLNLAAACGANPRVVLLLSAMLCVALVFM